MTSRFCLTGFTIMLLMQGCSPDGPDTVQRGGQRIAGQPDARQQGNPRTTGATAESTPSATPASAAYGKAASASEAPTNVQHAQGSSGQQGPNQFARQQTFGSSTGAAQGALHTAKKPRRRKTSDLEDGALVADKALKSSPNQPATGGLIGALAGGGKGAAIGALAGKPVPRSRPPATSAPPYGVPRSSTIEEAQASASAEKPTDKVQSETSASASPNVPGPPNASAETATSASASASDSSQREAASRSGAQGGTGDADNTGTAAAKPAASSASRPGFEGGAGDANAPGAAASAVNCSLPRGAIAWQEDFVRDDIKTALREEPRLANTNIDVSVAGSKVDLSGTVTRNDQRTIAEETAEAHACGMKITNNLKLRSDDSTPSTPPR